MFESLKLYDTTKKTLTKIVNNFNFDSRKNFCRFTNYRIKQKKVKC